MIKVLQSEWRSGVDSVGIVLGELGSGQKQAYIGVSKNTTPEADAQHIANWGCRLSFAEAKAFFPELLIEEYDGGLGS